MAEEARVVMAVPNARDEPAMTRRYHERHLSGGIKRDSRVKEHEVPVSDAPGYLQHSGK